MSFQRVMSLVAHAAARTQPDLHCFDKPLTRRLHLLGASLLIGVVSRLRSPLRGLREGERDRAMWSDRKLPQLHSQPVLNVCFDVNATL